MDSSEVIINKNMLESYKETISSLRFAMQESSGKSAKAIQALRNFLLDWFGKDKYQKNVIDAENLYFSKKMAEQAIAIFKENATVTSKNISSYVKNALAAISIDDFFFSQKDITAFEKRIGKELQAIIDEIEEKQPQEQKKDKSSDNKETTEKVTEKYKAIDDLTKKNIHIANVKQFLNIIPNFLEKNVFADITGILKGNAANFENDTLKIIKTKNLGSKNIFNSLYIPDISRLYKRFKRFEYTASRGIIYKTRAIIKKAAKRIKQAMNDFFPFTLITKILKTGTSLISTGLKVVNGVLGIGISLVSGALKFVFGTIKLVTGTILKIGTASIKLLSKTLDKIGAFKLIKLTVKGMFAFFKTYAGAYVLGYLIGSIYKNLKKILNFAKIVIDGAEKWFNDNIYIPYVEPIVKWIEEGGYNFYIQEIQDTFNDGSSLSESLDNVIEEFTFYDKEGKKTIDFSEIHRKIYFMTEWMRENFTGSRIKDIVLDTVAPMAGGMLGSIAGAHLGAALGTMIWPGVGTVAGGIIFSLLGGMAGENLGGIIRELIQDNAPFTKIESEETKFGKYSRQMLGLRNQQKAVFSNPIKSEQIKALQKVGSMASSFEYMDEKSYQPLIASGLFSIKQIETILSDKSKKENFQKQISQFKNIGNLSYDNIYKEITIAFNEMGEKLLNSNHKGAIYKEDLNDSDWKTYLTLNGGGSEPLLNLKNKVRNPFWFRIIRAIKIQQNLNKLERRRLNPIEFLNKYNDLSSGEKSVFMSGAENTIFFNGKNHNIFKLIYSYDEHGRPPKKEIDNWTYITEFELRKNQTELNNIETQFRYSDKNDKSIQSFLMAMRKYYGERISRNKNTLEKMMDFEKNLIYWIPTDTNAGFWKTLFAGRQVEQQDVRDLITKNAFKMNSLGITFNGKQNALYEDILGINPDYRTVNKANVLYRLGMPGINFDELSEEDQRKQIIAALDAELAKSEFSPIEMVKATVGGKLQATIDAMSSERTAEGKQISDQFNKIPINSDFLQIAEVVSNYRDIISANTDFMQKQLLPFLKALSEKGMSSEEMGNWFGFIYNPNTRAIERYIVDTSEEKDVSPNVDM